MKILIMADYAPPNNPGGAGRVAHQQAVALKTLGHDVTILSTRQKAEDAADIEVDGIQIHRLLINYPERWRAYLSLYNPSVNATVKQSLGEFRPDVVHAHNIHNFLTYHSFAMVKKRGIPLLLTCHDVMPVDYGKFDRFIDAADISTLAEVDYRISHREQIRKYRLRYFPLRNAIIRRQIRKYVDVLVTPSSALMDMLVVNGISAGQLAVLHNGVDTAFFESIADEQYALLDRLDLHDRKIILFPGRINRAKGADQLLKALPVIVEQVPEAILLILSKPGGYGEKLAVFAESGGLRQYTRFAGWHSGRELAASFAMSDVVVVPSVYLDPFPTVNLEAQAAGTPVVGTCFGGTPEAVEHGKTGLIVNPYDIEALASSIIRLLTDDVLRSEMGANAKKRMQAEFDWLRQAQKLVELYTKVQNG